MSKTIDQIQNKLSNDRYLQIILWLLIFSYFYNLPVMNYSIKGNNELRLYDFLGVVLVYYYIKYFQFVNYKIKRIIFFRYFNYFLIYCSISIISTLLFSIFYKERILLFVQSFLYLYHMWVFYLGSVFLFIYLVNIKKYRRIVFFIILLTIAESLLVILQNLGIIPFLWNDEYYKSYGGFLSGTYGPNKIVLGMSMVISFALVLGILFEKRIKMSKIFLYVSLGVVVISILLSGSRTSYVGLLVFLIYFFFKKTGKFMYFGIVVVILFNLMISINPMIYEKIEDTINDRIVDKIETKEAIESPEDIAFLYQNLGAGRDKLQLLYVNLLFDKPFIIPFGVGFNNRIFIRNSAHNIYLTLINEVGIVGLFLYIRWLLSYLFINKRKFSFLQLSLNGLVLSMIVTLFFGEHLYIYRPLFGILGYFMVVCVLLLVPFTKKFNEK